MAVGIGGLELDGLIEGFERGLHLAGLAENFAAGAEGAGALRVLGDDGVDFGQCLAGLAVVVKRHGAGDHRVVAIGIHCCGIIDPGGAAFDQFVGPSLGQGRADDRRFDGGLRAGA